MRGIFGAETGYVMGLVVQVKFKKRDLAFARKYKYEYESKTIIVQKLVAVSSKD
jgi:hypothetical protein